jgi:exo-beta-1,3-glucanase (GH17 family)
MFDYDNAICYSGYREGQSPLTGVFPSKEEILEDLKILEGKYYYLRLYDCTRHAYFVLDVIKTNNLNFKVMLGLHLLAEENHEGESFHGKYDDFTLNKNRFLNETRIDEIIQLGNKYEEIVSAISVGNETRSPWSNHRVSIDRLISATMLIQESTNLPVTFCEEYGTWIRELAPLAEVVDFISLHTYPAWEGKDINEAVEYAIECYAKVANAYPDKECIITETGWPTSSHGSRIKKEVANAKNQTIYNKGIMEWAEKTKTLVYLFEAFDEPWKGGNIPEEPEKNWGIYDVDRKHK